MTYILFATAFSVLSTAVFLVSCMLSAQMSRFAEDHENVAQQDKSSKELINKRFWETAPIFQYER